MLRLLGVLVVVALLGAPAAAQAASSWLPAGLPVSAAGQDANVPDVAIDRDGNVLAVWDRSDGATQRVEATFRPAGGSFSTPVRLSEAGRTGWFPQVAFDPQGNALAVWAQSDGAVFRIHAAFRPAGGDFGPGQTISTGNDGFPRVAFDGAGNALVAWVGPTSMKAAFRPAGGTFAPAGGGSFPGVDQISGAGFLTNEFDLGFDKQGNAMVAWPRKLSTNAAAVDASIEAAIRPAGGTFAPPIGVSPPAKAAQTVQLAFEPGGGALVTYLFTGLTGTANRVHAAYRPPGGVFAPPQVISATTDRTGSLPDVATDAGGNAVAVWMEGFWTWAAARPPGGAFASAVRVSPLIGNTFDPRVAFDAKGNAFAMWTQQNLSPPSGDEPPGFRVATAVRLAGATDFGPLQRISDTTDQQYSRHDMAFDAAGNGVALWRRYDGSKQRIEIAGYDGAAPVFRGTTIPATGLTGTPIGFAAAAVDVWSPVTLGWQFGDGATATGAAVAHGYPVAGTYPVAVSATDALGNTATTGSNVAVAPAPNRPAPDLNAPATDRVAPDLTALRLSRTRFRAARRGAPFTAAATPTGATVRFTLSEAASVRFTVERATSGRRVGGACRRVSAQNRARARCTRYVAVKGSSTLSARKGSNSRSFRGRLNARALSAGRYRLVARATDAAGNRSAIRRAAFRIVRR